MFYSRLHVCRLTGQRCFKTDIGDFSESFQGGSGPVAIERVSVGISVRNGKDDGKVDFMINAHDVVL